MAKRPQDDFSPSEAALRFEAALRAGLNTPAKPHSEMKIGKRRKKTKKSPEPNKRGDKY
jgi:hypothetical protein